MQDLLNKVFENPLNKKLIDFIGLEITFPLLPLANDGHIYYETAELFIGYTSTLPANIKYMQAGNGLLIIPDSGLIFGVTYGLGEIIFRCNTHHFSINNSDNLRVLTNQDGIYSDIRELGEDWAFLMHFIGDEEEALESSYKKAHTQFNLLG